MKPKTRYELAKLATAAEVEAERLERRITASKSLTLAMPSDELHAFAQRLLECAAVVKEYHAAVTGRKSA